MASKQAANFACKCGITVVSWQDSYKLRYPDCPKCRVVMRYMREASAGVGGRPPTHNYDVPIEMFSCGLIEGELKSFSLANREIDLTDQGVPIAKTRLEKKQIMDYFNMKENN